jgi:membrane-bound lytic murein transglycosylase D
MYTAKTVMCKTILFLLVIMLLDTGRARGQEQHDTQEGLPSHFPYPAALRPQVEFWKKIFTAHSRYDVVIHDSQNMKVYKVLEFQRLIDEEGLDESTVSQIRQDQTKLEMELIRASLLKLHRCNRNCGDLSPEEQAIRNLYENNDDPEKFREAASEDRLRAQSGIRERFMEGIQVSRRYIKAMEEIFRREGLPVELTRLPLIESSFNLSAYSKAGAAGIWQFMPSTGRLYMRVNNIIDERRDPLIATEAAAQFLRANYEKLGTWPLAITAYNHGANGMMGAISTLGTSDIADIIRLYRGPAFGFSSRNFYPEFLAALLVEKNYKEHFGTLDMEAPLTYDEVYIDFPISIRAAAKCADTGAEEMLSLNPALGSAVRDGHTPVPRGYQLRIPAGGYTAFLPRYEAWQVGERERLAALERTRKERLAALRKARAARLATLKTRRGARGKTAMASAKSGKGKAANVRKVSESETRSRKRKG